MNESIFEIGNIVSKLDENTGKIMVSILVTRGQSDEDYFNGVVIYRSCK